MIERLRALAQGVPQHVVNYGFRLSKRPVGGDWFLYTDNLKGMGRQHIASIPADRSYFGTLHEFMAAASPVEVLALVRRVEAAEQGMEAAIREAVERGRAEGIRDMREAATAVLWALNEKPPESGRRTFYEAAQAVAKVSP